MKDLELAWALITSPSAAYAELRERPRFVFPLIALVGAMSAMLLWYYSAVDFEWLKDHLFSDNPRFQQMSDAGRAKAMSMMSQKMMISTSVIGAAIGLPLVLVLQAGYYMLAGKITNVQQSFLQWFSLVSWSGLPGLVGVFASMVLLLIHGTHMQVSPSELQMLSLNELFFQRTPSQPGYQLLSQLSLLNIWTWSLLVIGVRTWSNRSWLYSTVFVLLPFVAIYGGWAFFAFR